MASWKRDAASGMVVVVPILISVYVVVWFYGLLAGIPLLNSEALALKTWEKVVILLAAFAGLVLGMGYVMRTAVGEVIEGWIDQAANRVPLVRVVYNASKMAVDTALSGTDDLQEPVKLEPWDGMRMTAFRTGKTTGDGRDVLFLPTAPNITTGYVIEVDPADYEPTDENLEEALTRILSAGFGETNDAEVSLGVNGDSRRESPEGGSPTVE